MAQLKLINASGRTIKVGDPVKIHATKKNSFDFANLGDIVIGTLASQVNRGSYGVVNLLGSNVPAEITQVQIDAIIALIPPVDVTGAVSDYLVANPPSGGVTLSAVKTDTDIASAISLKHALQDLSGLQVTSAKGAANGYAPLDASSKVPIGNLPDTILGSVNYHGTFSAAGGINPTVSPLALQGDYFVISVAGTISTVVYAIGDWIIYSGSVWERVDNSDKVSSVNGATGAVVLNPDNLDDTSSTHKFGTGSNTGDETSARIATIRHAASEKTTLVDADEISGQDSAATFGLIRTTWTNVKAFLKTYFDGLYNPKRLFTNLAAPVVSSGTTEKILIQLAIPGARAVSGSAFRAWIMGLSSSTGTLIFKVRAGAGGTITDAVACTFITSAAQVANKRAGFDALSIVRSATTLYTDGVAYAGSLQLETVIAAAATSAVTISGAWYISLTVICSSGTFTANVGLIEEIR